APELVAAVARSLEKRREDRFPSAGAMLEALDVATMAQAALDLKDPSALLLRVSMLRPAAGASAAPPVAAPPPAPGGGQPRRPPPPGPAQVDKLELDLDRALRRDQLRIPTGPMPAAAPRPPGTRRLAWAGLGAAALVAGVVAYVALRQGGQAPAPPLEVLAASTARAKSEQAVAAEKRLSANDAAGAVALLEGHLTDARGSEDAYAQLVLGHARFQLDRDADSLAAYETALGLNPALAGDVTMRVNLAAMVGRKDRPKFALQALELMFTKLGPLGHALIIETASRGKSAAVRKRARERAEERGLTGEVDLLGSYSLDLAQGASCKDRREAIPKLRALRDKRAVAALKKARDRRGGFLNLADVNDCLERDAQEAMDFLQAL